MTGSFRPDGRDGSVDAAYAFGESLILYQADPGNFRVALVDQNGQEAALRSFEWAFSQPVAPDQPQPFALRFASQPLLSAVRLYYQDQLLDELLPGPSPLVTITSPVPAELVGPSFTLTWDGSPGQSYLVRYSRDGGANWLLLSAPITTTALEIDLVTLPGSDNGIFEVIASFGLLSQSAQTRPFTLVDAGPQVFIYSPQAGVFRQPRTEFTLSGAAFDLEDGWLDGTQLVWRSDVDGLLGTGSLVNVQLSPGAHLISLQVIDSRGNLGQAQVWVNLWAVFMPVSGR